MPLGLADKTAGTRRNPCRYIGSTSPWADLFDMQDEIVARLANTLNAQRRRRCCRGLARGTGSEPRLRGPLFSGRLGLAHRAVAHPLTMSRKLAASSIARLTADPDNVEALVGSASADAIAGVPLFVTDPAAAFLAAEAKSTTALSSVPDHARAHLRHGTRSTYTPSALRRVSPTASTPPRWRSIEISPNRSCLYRTC